MTTLEAKYVELVALARERREAMRRGRERFEAVEREDRRRRMRALAQGYPGALRELDGLSEAELVRRLEALRAGRSEPWMKAAALMHAEIREELARRAGGGGSAPGRLMDGVWRRVGEALGCAPDEAERLVYGGGAGGLVDA
jgi:hypothetical protein